MQSETGRESARDIFLRVFQQFRPAAAVAQVDVEFRRSAGVTSVIEFRQSRLRVRVADLFESAPEAVQEALAHLLVAKMLRHRPAAAYMAKYRRFLNSADVVRRAQQQRRERGRKRMLPPAGQSYDLTEVFETLNLRFFDGLMARPVLGWSPSPSRRILGHYDPAHHVIVISRLLDGPHIPRLVLEYVMYHEMLHLRYPVERRGTRRCVHGEEFRRAEAEFPGFEEAKRLLGEICRLAAGRRDGRLVR
jgi:hypothetical protein